LDKTLLKKRRERVFGGAVLTAGVAVLGLCLMSSLLAFHATSELLLPTALQERFFFDVFSIVAGCWLLSWVSAVNGWTAASRVGQWLGIILLCANEAILVSVWQSVFGHLGTAGSWMAPMVIQLYLFGCFFGFFTLPSLTANGNLRITGLGTLMILLPWLCGRDAIASGAHYLHGLII